MPTPERKFNRPKITQEDLALKEQRKKELAVLMSQFSSLVNAVIDYISKENDLERGYFQIYGSFDETTTRPKRIHGVYMISNGYSLYAHHPEERVGGSGYYICVTQEDNNDPIAEIEITSLNEHSNAKYLKNLNSLNDILNSGRFLDELCIEAGPYFTPPEIKESNKNKNQSEISERQKKREQRMQQNLGKTRL